MYRVNVIEKETLLCVDSEEFTSQSEAESTAAYWVNYYTPGYTISVTELPSETPYWEYLGTDDEWQF